jgi:peptidoglycan/LPS O-acetylase OafA/YrhL
MPRVNVFIRQLTGIRFVAAAWVLLYHFQGPLGTIGVTGVPVFGDVIRVGRLGVDLFFALSGFILTHTYLTRMGPRLQARATLKFWWLRLARIYPVHLVMIVIAALAMLAQARITGAEWKSWFTPEGALAQVLLVQEWGPNPQRGWNFVAWSISMEWLAYLVFPLLVLALWIFARRLPTAILVIGWILALLPLMRYGLDTTNAYYMHDWGSTIRIATEFTAGAFTYLIIRRFLPESSADPTPLVERIATVLSVMLPLLVVAGAVFLANLPAAQPPARTLAADAEPLPPYFHLLLVPLLVAWIGALALSRRGLARWLATSTLILGGFISYSLYMTHMVWFGLWRVVMDALGISGGALYAVGVVVLIGASLVIAWLMWRIVEEPAREWMRRLIGVRPTPTEEAGEAIVHQSSSTIQHDAEPISVPMADRPEPRAKSGDE